MKSGILFLVIGFGDLILTAVLVGSFDSAMPRLLIDLAFIGYGSYRLWRWRKGTSKKKAG